MTYVIARTGRGRPTLQHELSPQLDGLTLCGLDISWWSRAYQRKAIPEILCKKCNKRGA